MLRIDRSACVRIFGVVAMMAIAMSVTAQGPDAERQFRKWASERVDMLTTHRDPARRAEAAEYLGSFTYPDVIAALAAALEDPDARVRAAAAGSRWESGQASLSARASLVRALDDPAASVAIRAAGALQMLGMPESELVRTRRRVFETQDVSSVDRYMAARGLIGQMPPAALLSPILQFLENAAMPRPSSAKSIAQRESLESAVNTLNRLAKTGNRSLIAPMQDAARVARHSQPAVLDALALFNPKPDGWVAFLMDFLESPNPKVRHASLVLLGKEVREKDVALWAPRAAQRLRDPDESVRGEAVWALGRAGGLAALQVEAVVALLADPDAGMRRRAVATLGEMGDKVQPVTAAAKARVAQSARAPLAAMAESDPDADVRAEARKTLAKIGSGGPSPGPVATVEPHALREARRGDGASRGDEASAVALLRERKIAMEPGSYFQALAATDVAVVRAFLDAGMSASDPVAGSGPPLVVALQAGEACAPAVRPTKADTTALVRLLLERKADANRGDANGFTPLMAAAMKGCDRGVMKLLIGAGAKVGATNKMGLSAFEMGLFYGHDGLEELIAGGYRLPPDKAKLYETTYAQKPTVLGLVRKAAK
jgi:HEAT repeat protein